MAEARTATALLGVSTARQFFLGYPDGGIAEIPDRHRSTEYHAKLTGEARVPYSDALFPGHPYTGESLERDVSRCSTASNRTSSWLRVRSRASGSRSERDCSRSASARAPGIGRALLDRPWRRGLAEPARASCRASSHAAPSRHPDSRHSTSNRRRGGREAPRRERLSHADASHGALPAGVRAYERALLGARYAYARGAASGDATIQYAGDPLLQAVDPGAPCQLRRLRISDCAQSPSNTAATMPAKAACLDLLVGFEIPLEAPAVEVARADRHPVVRNDHLRVQHARLVFEDAHVAAKHLAVEAPGGLSAPTDDRSSAPGKQTNIDAAARCASQRFAKTARGTK